VVTAARDFGLRTENLERLALRFSARIRLRGRVAVAVADAVLDRNS
jgi:hypothetical protein